MTKRTGAANDRPRKSHVPTRVTAFGATAHVAPTTGRLASLIRLNAVQPFAVDSQSSDSSSIGRAARRRSAKVVARPAPLVAPVAPALEGAAPDACQGHTPASAGAPRLEDTFVDKQVLLRRLLCRDAWLHALYALRILLSNTLLCISCVWMAAFCFSHGNVVSGKAAALQSDSEFVAGTVVAVHVLFFVMVLFVQLPLLQSLTFVHVSRRDGPVHVALFCLKRLLQHTYRVFVLTGLIGIALFVQVRPDPAGVKMFAVKIHTFNFVMHLNTTAITLAARRIYIEDSIAGRSKWRSLRRRHFCDSIRQFAKTYLRTLPKALFVTLAAVYIQAIRDYRITGMGDFVAFALGSLVLKLVVKEVARRGITKLSVTDPRTIFLIIAQPTVLIDTQVRIVLQRVPNTKYTLMWTFGMAVLEIVLRWSKVLMTRKEVRRQEVRFAEVVAQSQARSVSEDSVMADFESKPDHHRPSATTALAQTAVVTSAQALTKWRHQILTFQIAESYANMSAEYIAMGCSTCVLYFYFDHPKYELGGRGASQNASTSILPWSRTSSLGVQVVVEVVVDYLSCALEISAGVDFEQLRRYRVFLALLFITLATVNIQVCALMYLRV